MENEHGKWKMCNFPFMENGKWQMKKLYTENRT